MRKIDWEQKLSDEDIEWLRAAGFMSEEQIAQHQDQFDAKVPEPEIPDDPATRSALDASSRANTSAETGDGPRLVDPTQADPQDEEQDDYDQWTAAELRDEVNVRNDDENTGPVTVEGTGKGGAVTKADLIKGLRLWDAENPPPPEATED